jgi:hypothetical protein
LASLQDTVDALGARADGPCFDNTNRYVDCGNGTVTDTVTGLIWLKQWDCLPSDTWAAANHTVARLKDSDCSLTDKSSPGDWRLPTKAEWEATMARAGALGCVDPGGSRLGGLSLTNDAGTGCYVTGGSSFADLEASAFWSSSAAEIGPHNAWAALLNSGFVGLDSKSSGLTDVWPVRGGPR